MTGFVEMTSAIVAHWNTAAAVLHLGTAIAQVVILEDNEMRGIPLTSQYSKWERGACTPSWIGRQFTTTDNETYCIFTDTSDTDISLNLGQLVIAFHLLSFAFQSVNSLNYYCFGHEGWYHKMVLTRGFNKLRFLEYAFSATVMLVTIALLNGVTDIYLLTCLSALTAGCMICGLVAEHLMAENPRIGFPTWPAAILHFLGWVLIIAAYAVPMAAYYDSAEASKVSPPEFVTVIVWSMLGLFMCFGLVQFSEILTGFLRPDACEPYWHPAAKEFVYVTLSLVAKQILGWTLFVNAIYMP